MQNKNNHFKDKKHQLSAIIIDKIHFLTILTSINC